MELTDNEKKLLVLLSKEEKSKPAKYFSDEMGYSVKLIYQVCSSLSEKISKKYNVNLIEKIPRHGIKLVDPYNYLESILSDDENGVLLSDEIMYSKDFRKIYMLLDLLNDGKFSDLQDYVSTFFVSEVTVQKDYLELVTLLQKSDICIMKKVRVINEQEEKTGFLIDKLTLFLKKFIMDVAEKNNNTFDSYINMYSEIKGEKYFIELLIAVTSFCNFSYSKQSLSLQEHHLDSLILSIYFYLISELRNHRSVQLLNTNFSAVQLEQLEWYVYVVDFSNELKSSFDLIISERDIQEICHLLVIHGFEFTDVAGDWEDGQLTQIVDQLINRMSIYLNINLKNNHRLKKALIKHMVPMIQRLKKNIYIKNPLVSVIKKQYSSVFQLISVAVGELENTFDILLNEDENAFLVIHFQVAIEAEIDIKHVFIVCKEGLLTSELIFNKLNQMLPRHTVIELVTSEQLKLIPTEKIDLVVSSLIIEKGDYEVCYVSVLPSDEELKKVIQVFFDITLLKNRSSIDNITSNSVFSRFIIENNVFLNQDFKNIESIFKFLSDEFHTRNISKLAIQDELNKRELLGYTSLNTGIAIPHVAPHLINESTVMIVTLKKAIQWGGNKVSLIMLLALAEEDVFVAKEIIEEIQGVIESNDRIQAISKSKSFNEFQERFLSRRGVNGYVQ